MAKTNPIKAEKRDFSKSPKQLRANGIVPATVYGPDYHPNSIQMDAKSFKNVFRSDKITLLELKLGQDSLRVLPKNVQHDPKSGSLLNIEFYKVKSDEKVRIAVPITLENQSPAVKMGGKLWNPIGEIEIECMPDNMPDSIIVDISRLTNLEDSLTVGEVNYPEGVTPVFALDSIVVKVNAPKEIKVQAQISDEINQLTK